MSHPARRHPREAHHRDVRGVGGRRPRRQPGTHDDSRRALVPRSGPSDPRLISRRARSASTAAVAASDMTRKALPEMSSGSPPDGLSAVSASALAVVPQGVPPTRSKASVCSRRRLTSVRSTSRRSIISSRCRGTGCASWADQSTRHPVTRRAELRELWDEQAADRRHEHTHRSAASAAAGSTQRRPAHVSRSGKRATGPVHTESATPRGGRGHRRHGRDRGEGSGSRAARRETRRSTQP